LRVIGFDEACRRIAAIAAPLGACVAAGELVEAPAF